MAISDKGTLYVVATPIGNLEDLSPRACKVLAQATVIAAEDTRAARRLLAHFSLHGTLISLHEHNEVQRVPGLIERLEQGADVALISEAGVPCVSDPGFRLVEGAHASGVNVVGVPGACAAVTALSIAGLPTDRFLFLGFPPPRRGKRRALLRRVAAEPGTLVFYESPHRILATLKDIELELSGREVVLARELTKRHEELVRGCPPVVAGRLEENDGERLRGEMTLLVEGAGRGGGRGAAEPPDLGGTQGLKALSRQLAAILGVPARDAYRALMELKAGGEPDGKER